MLKVGHVCDFDLESSLEITNLGNTFSKSVSHISI